MVNRKGENREGEKTQNGRIRNGKKNHWRTKKRWKLQKRRNWETSKAKIRKWVKVKVIKRRATEIITE